jgi:hypothetical protein
MVVGRWPCLVLTINMIIIMALVPASFDPIKIEDEQRAWTPEGNPSLFDADEVERLGILYKAQAKDRDEYKQARDRRSSSINDGDEIKEFSGEKDQGFVSLMVIAKYPNDTANPNLLTRASFNELIELERQVLNETYLEMNFTTVDEKADKSDDDLE